jgi:hypothetical protein
MVAKNPDLAAQIKSRLMNNVKVPIVRQVLPKIITPVANKIAPTLLSKLLPILIPGGAIIGAVISGAIIGWQIGTYINEDLGLSNYLQDVFDELAETPYQSTISMIENDVVNIIANFKKGDFVGLERRLASAIGKATIIADKAPDANTEEKEMAKELVNRFKKLDAAITKRISDALKKAPPSVPRSDSDTMKEIQELINTKLKAKVVNPNGFLGNQNTYKVLAKYFGLTAGKQPGQYHNYQQLLGMLKATDPKTLPQV